ncbi:MAG: tetratricopeptide repeat protein [Nitrospira sp.]|nr:tetratricopeptide repeat protein [Nitrospira sp.]
MMAPILCIRFTILLTVLCLLGAPVPVAALPSKSLPPYLEGLDALNEGRWPDAVSAFSRALDQAGDDPDIVLARGVAQTLAEDFPRAQKDLNRAQRLGLKGREAQLWLYATEAMSGLIVVPDHALGGGPRGVPSGRPAVVSIPGHVAQGHDDYTSDYGSFIVYRLAMEYQKHRLPRDFGGSGNPTGTKSPQIRQAILKAGQLFAEKNYRRPELASLNVSRAKQASGGKATVGSMVHVERALVSNPGDPDAHYQAGTAWLDAGRPASARKEFTIALTLKPDFPDAYLGRATAAARLGDAQRMEADLSVYKKAGWLSTRSARSGVENELSSTKVNGSAESFLTELQEAARGDKPMEHLVAVASKLHRAMGHQRLRYDEIYQDHLRVLHDSVQEHPKSPDTLVALATYMVEEADNRGETVEPRRELQPYRFQESREKELQRAILIADQALGLNAKHVGAMMQKALALTALKQYNQAEKLADQALNVARNDPDALRLYAKFRALRANQLSNEAAGLRQERCSSSSHDETRSDGVYRVTTTTCYPPSQADLNRAAQLDALAADLRRRAKAALETAAKVTKGTVDGYLILADLALWDGKSAEAQGFLEQAVKLDPKSLEAQDRLVQHYAQTGQPDKAEEQRLIAANLVQTTVAPLLRQAWKRAEKTAWQGAKSYLARAYPIDPEDARIPAYLGVIHEGDDQRDEAAANYRTALALEEARLQSDELNGDAGTPLGRDALEFGLAIQARFHLARLAEQAGQQTDALTHYQAVLGYETRMKPGFESRQMFTAMWPDQQPEKGALVMAPKNASTLVADAHVRAGKLLAAMGNHDESIEHFRAAARYGPLRMAGMPQIGNGRGDSNFAGLAGAPAAEAQFYLAKELMAKGDLKGAQQVLYEAGRTLPDDLRGQLNELNMAMGRLQSRRPRDSYAGMSEEKQPDVERQLQQDQERSRMAVRQMAPRARVVPEVVGRWEMTPNNQFLPKKTLTIANDARYRLASTDGSTSEGKMDVKIGRDPVRGRPDPSRGQMMLYVETSGQIETMWYEFTGEGAMEITEMDSTKYVTKRQP